MEFDIKEILCGLKEFELIDGSWERIPWTYEEWRTAELSGLPKYWRIQERLEGLPPHIRVIAEASQNTVVSTSLLKLPA